MSGAPIILPARHVINIVLGLALIVFIVGLVLSGSAVDFWLIVILALALGALLIIPIGGADMPVVISMLNSYSGWAAAGIGFTLGNSALIITGALVGSSGAILSYIMCHAMNRSFISVILGGFRRRDRRGGWCGCRGAPGQTRLRRRRRLHHEERAEGHHRARLRPWRWRRPSTRCAKMADTLKKEGVEVKYAIHPVAGRMPGHMNVLLAEANVPYDEVVRTRGHQFRIRPGRRRLRDRRQRRHQPGPPRDDPKSPIYGMPVLQVWKAGTVMFIKRSLASGYAGIDNPLFYRDNTMMLLGDAKKMTENIVKAL